MVSRLFLWGCNFWNFRPAVIKMHFLTSCWRDSLHWPFLMETLIASHLQIPARHLGQFGHLSCGVPPAMTAIPSAGLNLGAATEEEIREFLGSISADERQKVLDALKIVAGSSEPGPKPVKLVASYIMQATDGEWGFYLMEVKLNSDATGSVKEQVSTSAESPEVTEVWSGNFHFGGDSMTFQGTEVEMMSDTGKVAELLGATERHGNMFSFKCFMMFPFMEHPVEWSNLQYII